MEGYYFVFTSFICVAKYISQKTRIPEPKPKWKVSTSYLLRPHASQNILVRKHIFLRLSLNGRILLLIYFTSSFCVTKYSRPKTRIPEPKPKGKDSTSYLLRPRASTKYIGQKTHTPEPKPKWKDTTSFICVTKYTGQKTRIPELKPKWMGTTLYLLRSYASQNTFVRKHVFLSLSLNGMIVLRIYFVHMSHKIHWSENTYSWA